MLSAGPASIARHFFRSGAARPSKHRAGRFDRRDRAGGTNIGPAPHEGTADFSASRRRGSEIRLVGLRYRHHDVIEKVEVVLRTDHFSEGVIRDAPPALDRR